MSKLELYLLSGMINSNPNPKNSPIPSLSFLRAQSVPEKEPSVMCSFLSTSKRRDLAESYLSQTQRRNEDIQAVLIHIDLDDRRAATCASIAHLSAFGIAEDEVIVMIGSIFSATQRCPTQSLLNC